MRRCLAARQHGRSRRAQQVIGFLTTASLFMRFGRAHFAKVRPRSRPAGFHGAQARSLLVNSDHATNKGTIASSRSCHEKRRN
jgi:hypothetical protein